MFLLVIILYYIV